MSDELNKLKKGDLIALIEQLKAQISAPAPATTPAAEAAPVEAGISTESLIAALLAERRQSQAARSAAEGLATEPVYGVENVGNSALVVFVKDDRGQPKRFAWNRRNDVQSMTASQLAELNDEYPELFEEGKLAAPEYIADNANVIRDFEKFVRSLNLNNMRERINSITSRSVLFGLYHHLESQRYANVEDEKGKPGIEVVELSPLNQAVLSVVQQRLKVVAGVSTSDSE